MTQRNNVGEGGEGKPRESWQTTGRFHVWLSADEQTRPSQTRLGARRCHLGQWNQQRGARRMSAPIHSASPRCQRSGAWRHKQRERQKKMRACGGHPGRGREALEEQRLWGHKRRGEDGRTKKEKEKLLFKRSFGHLPPSEQWGWHQRADLWVGKSVNLARQQTASCRQSVFSIGPTVSGNSRTNHLHLFWIKMPKEGLTAWNNCSKEHSG